MPGRGINLLCIDGGIDGGWVQGLSALVLIRKLMEFIDSDHPPKPCEYFDMIGGTGMGGVIAIMLGRLGMTVDECSNHYAALQDRIFCSIIGKPFSNHNRHDHMALELGIKTILRSRGLEDDALFKNSDKAACKVFVTVTCAGTTTIDVLASYYRRKGAAELYNTATIWQAARATSADSTVFEPINIGPSKRRFLGGGTGANNPIFILWEEAMGAFSRHGHLEGNLNCIVSLGCGIGCLERFGENAAIRAKTVDRIVKETDETAKRFLNNRPTVLDTGIYHRFSAPNVGNIINSEDMTSVLQMTDHYIDNKETQDRLQLCTSKLLMRGGVSKVLQILDDRHQAHVRAGPWSSEALTHRYSASQKEHFDIFNHISKYECQRTLERISEDRCSGTCNWILDMTSFHLWLEQKIKPCFILSGIIGSGKTICTSAVVDHLQDWSLTTGRQVFHFFYESSFQSRLTATDVIEAFIKQIIIASPDVPAELYRRIRRYYGPESVRPHIGKLRKHILLPLIHHIDESIFIIDGLDECELSSRQDLFDLIPTLIAEGSSVFVSLRDAAELVPRFPSPDRLISVDCSLSEYGSRRDLEVFVSELMERQNLEQNITDDQRVLTLIKTNIIDKADAMFLWAKLLIIDIWAECNDVQSITNYLINRLPHDLDEIYTRHRARIHHSRSELSQEIFDLVCGAIEPFSIEELQEILTVREQEGKLFFKREKPLIGVIKDCGAKLLRIRKTHPKLVLPIHHSVRQHVFQDRRLGLPRAHSDKATSIELHIGLISMLCIKQRSDWSLIKTNAQRPRTSYKDASAIGFMQSSMIKRAYEAVYGKPKHIAKVIPQFQSSLDPDKIKALYRYAQKSWIQSNRHLRADSWTSWNMFCKLAAERHYGVQYPWLRFQTSHLHGLFCWAVTHGHIALMELVINEPHLRAAKKIDLFNKPLLPPDGGFALHYAARSGNTEVFLRLFDHVDVFKLDNNGDTALHLGAQTGQRIVTACYTRSSILPFITHSRPHWKNSSGQNPLHMAMLSANLACVSDVMDVSKVKVPKLPCTVLECWHNAKDNNNDKPFDLAMTHGDIDFLQSCFELYVKKKIGLPPMTSVLRTSVRLQNWDLLEYLISRSDIPADTCPFDAENEFPDLSAPIARHLMELIFKRRENWIPQLLVDSWNAGTEDFRNLILSMMPDLYEHSNPHNHFIFLEICRNIKRSTITCSSPLSRPGESISLSWPKISHHDDVGKLWATFVALEAVVANDLGALRFALSKEAEIPAILLYEAICTGNEEIKDCVIKHLPKDKRLSRSVRRGAVAIAEERRKPMVQSELIALVQTVNRGLYAEVTE